MPKFQRCACDTGAPYHKCCQPFHDGAIPESALKLMRSRFAAYALNIPDYIIQTTHKEHPEYDTNTDAWRLSITQFSEHTKFDKLRIREFEDGDEEAFVTFTAFLRQAGQDASFTEKSRFFKVDGKWLYHSGDVSTFD